MEHPTVYPTLSYDDAQAAADFLGSAFGAEQHAVYTDDKGTIHHAEFRFGNGMVMFGSSRPDIEATRGAGGGIYIVIDDPDEHCARARGAGAEIVSDLHDTEYGSREYSARDPEGNMWHFGTYQPFTYDPKAQQAAQAS
jgi:uncharacterized glyoxalase superfamily protein PhnB